MSPISLHSTSNDWIGNTGFSRIPDHVPGDLLVIFYAYEGAATVTLGDGSWTRLFLDVLPGAGHTAPGPTGDHLWFNSSACFAAWYKIATDTTGPSDVNGPSITADSGSAKGAGTTFAFRHASGSAGWQSPPFVVGGAASTPSTDITAQTSSPNFPEDFHYVLDQPQLDTGAVAEHWFLQVVANHCQTSLAFSSPPVSNMTTRQHTENIYFPSEGGGLNATEGIQLDVLSGTIVPQASYDPSEIWIGFAGTNQFGDFNHDHWTPPTATRGLVLLEAPVLVPVCIAEATWGYYGPLDGASITPGGGESAGYVEAGAEGTTFAASPPDGALLIATTARYSFHGTMPATGTLSGFGATWERIYYEEATGSGGAAFAEVWRAQQATYTVPDRLRYTFPAGSTGDGIYSSVGFQAFEGVDASGLSDNGASAIHNVASHGPTTGLSASYTQTTPYSNDSSLMWTGFWRISNNGSAGTSDNTPTPGWLYAHGSGRGGIGTDADSDAFIDNVLTLLGPTESFTWEAGMSRLWFAASLELLADPACAGVLNPYWGINATTVIPF